jgi:hypothetical protein
VAGRHGVRWAEVNEMTAQLLSAGHAVERRHGASDVSSSWFRPTPPSDEVPLTAVPAALGAVVTTRLARTLPQDASRRFRHSDFRHSDFRHSERSRR